MTAPFLAPFVYAMWHNTNMKLVVMVKLSPSEEQRRALCETLERFNEAANWIAGVAYKERTASKYKLQKLIYHDVRERFGLSAQMTVRCISKVCEVYKRDKSKKPTFREHGAMVYDERLMSFKGLDRVSLLTLGGRELVPVRLGDYQEARLDRRRGQADLIYRAKPGTFYLALSVDAPEPEPELHPSGTLGVDLGIVNLATDSDGDTHTGEDIEKARTRYSRIRRQLQSAGTKSAKRHLKKLSGREARFRKDTNHVISKKLVEKAKDTKRAVALEDLRHLRKRATVRKAQRSRHESWSYHQLRSFIEYKALLSGVLVHLVDPRNTSKTCAQCGHCERTNRRSQAEFVCKSCGHVAAADVNAAVNIAARGDVMRPIVSLAETG
jgi:putative transposase